MVFQAKSGVDVEKTVTDTQFKIATNSKLFSILSDSIYTKKIDAVIRELCCNAFDAHVEARQDRKFQVTLPSEFNPEFRVRDFGAGLCESDMQMYTTYGESTKSGSNAYIGAFGIGAKSPFAYTNTFNVTSYHDGMARAYSMFVEDGIPRMTKLGEAPTEEYSGLEVFFPVSLKDIDEFKEQAILICALMADRIEFLQVQKSWLFDLDLEVKKYHWKPADYIGQGYAVSDLLIDINYNHNYLYFVQGNVRYEMSIHEVSEMLKYTLGKEYDKLTNRIKASFYITGFLRVPNGTFVPHPSRERLTFDEITKATIKDIFCKIYEWHIKVAVDRILEGVKSYYDLHRRLQESSKLIASNYKIINFSIDEQNLIWGSSKIENYNTWRRFNFSCVQIIGGGDKIFRFRSVPQLNMYGNQIERIYYTTKYPLSEEYRYRVLKDKIQSETKNAILLFGSISQIFTEDDKATFVDVQALPKLTQPDLLNFKKKIRTSIGTGTRVSKKEVSYLYVARDPYGQSYERFSQLATDKVPDMTSEFPIYWVGSNKRYEFQLGSTLFHLKVKEDRKDLVSNYFDFFLDYIALSIPNLKKGDTLCFSVVVLPEGHALRGMLPELEDALKEGIRFMVANFLNIDFFEVSKPSSDVFFDKLIMHQELLLLAVSDAKGKEYFNFFTEWFMAGKPGIVDSVKQKSLPFLLFCDNEGILLKEDYYSKRNIWKLNVCSLYSYFGYDSIFPIFKIFHNFPWLGIYDDFTAEDIIEYMAYKLARIDKSGN
jgi:hypothetical protein